MIRDGDIKIIFQLGKYSSRKNPFYTAAIKRQYLKAIGHHLSSSV
jgi:hypothetical protein